MPPPQVSFELRPGAATDPKITATLFGRRQDLSALETEREIPMPQTRLAPGHWEMNARVGPGQYVESIANQFASARRPLAERTRDWFDVFIAARNPARMRIVVSDRAGQIGGTAMAEGSGVPGMPVFLWPVTDAARRAIGSKQMLSDTQGRFHFEGLPPGDYRMLATLDLSEVDEDALNEAKAITVHVDASQTVTVDLTPWIAP